MYLGRLLFAGLAGVVVLKIFGAVLLPLLGFLMGLLGFVVKMVVVVAVIAVLVALFRRNGPRTTAG